MMNLADLSALSMIVVGPLSGVGAAHAHNAGTLPLVLLGMAGLAIGIGAAKISSKFAYAILWSKTLPAGVGLLLYSFVLLAGFLVAGLAPYLLVETFLN